VNGFPPEPTIKRDPPLADLLALETLIRKQKYMEIATDVEASPPEGRPNEWAKLPMFARLRAIGIGVDHKNGLGLSWFWPIPRIVWLRLKALFENPEIIKVFMNGDAYDIPMLERHGVKFPRDKRGLLINIHDIADSRRTLSSTSFVSLEFQTGIYLCAPPWKAEAREDDKDVKGYVDAARVPRHKLLNYNGLDCVYTAQVRSKHVWDLKQDARDNPWLTRLYKQQRRLAKVAAGMSINGFPIDVKRRVSLAAELAEMGRERARKLAELISPYAPVRYVNVEQGEDPTKLKGKAFRITSNGGVNEADLAALCYRQCRRNGIKSFNLEVPLSDDCWTETGRPAVNRKALIQLMVQENTPPELRDIIRLCWQVDAPIKAKGTHVDSEIIRNRISPGIKVKFPTLHASHNSRGAETGRFSCSDPNMYNYSEQKKEDEGALQGDLPNLRDLFVAPPGYKIVHGDFKSFELETLQHVSTDKALRQMLDSGDVHTTRARAFFNIPDDVKVPKQIRRNGKIVGLQSQYHAGLGSVWAAVLMQVPDAEFDEISAIYHMFPVVHDGIAKHWRTSLEFAQRHGYNETDIMHRRRYYPPGDDIKDTETSNYQPQGDAADIANSTMVGIEEVDYVRSLDYRLGRYFPKAWLALHTYDSFDIIAPEREAQAVCDMMVETATGPWAINGIARHYKLDVAIVDRLSQA
jgi:DNA polymerase I-like protein with 3'-5' exonuclease and polymerase domains